MREKPQEMPRQKKRTMQLSHGDSAVKQEPERIAYRASVQTYTVDKGDTLYSIARKHEMTVDELKEMNKLSSNHLSIGQELIVAE